MFPNLNTLREIHVDRLNTTVWHSHHSTQIGYVLAGRVDVAFPGTQVTCLPDDFHLIVDGHLHVVTEHPNTRYYHGFVSLNVQGDYFTDNAERDSDLDWLAGKSLVVHQSPGLAEQLQQIVRWWQSDRLSGRLVAQCLVVQVFMELQMRQGRCISRDEYKDQSTEDLRLFQEAVWFIEQHYRDVALSVPDVAQACAVCRSTLDKSFKRRMDTGPKAFIQRYRVDRAKDALRHGDSNLTEIAQRTGFPDLFAFSRVFKRFVGVSPTGYLRSLRSRPSG